MDVGVISTYNDTIKLMQGIDLTRTFRDVGISAGQLLWKYRQLNGMTYIALARQVQIYHNISDPFGNLDPDYFGA